MSKRDEIIIQVPATTSNLGSGFDTLGLALSLHNFVKITPNQGGFISFDGPGSPPPGVEEMAIEAAAAFDHEAGTKVGGFSFDVWGEVPIARGLGSSATVRAGLLFGFNELCGQPLSEEELIRLGGSLDGAPDGIAAAFLGGFCISRIRPATGVFESVQRFDVSHDLNFVTLVPEREVLTVDQRKVLPAEIPFPDVVKSLNSLATLTAAFATGNYAALQNAVTDFIHQPYRERLCPFTHEAIQAGVAAGAYAGWLSGSGSSVICVAPKENGIDVGKAMLEVFENNGMGVRLFKLRAVNRGLREATQKEPAAQQ